MSKVKAHTWAEARALKIERIVASLNDSIASLVTDEMMRNPSSIKLTVYTKEDASDSEIREVCSVFDESPWTVSTADDELGGWRWLITHRSQK